MKILTNKQQNELIYKIAKLNKYIVNSDIDIECFDLLADIGCSMLDLKHLDMLESEIKKALSRKTYKYEKICNKNKT